MARAVVTGVDPRQSINGYINLKAGRLRDVYLEGLEGLNEIVTLERLAHMIDRRIKSAAGLELEFQTHWEEVLERMEPLLEQAARAGQNSVERHLVAMVQKQNQPHYARQGALEWLREHRDFLVTHFGRQTGESLEAILRRAAENDQYGAGTVARDLRGVLQLRPSQADRVARLYMQDRDSGLSVKAARQRALERRERALQDRVATVSQHETAQMWNRGALQAVQEAVANGEMDPNTTKVWLTVGDDRVCPICAPLHHEELPLDEPYENPEYGVTVKAPPAHIRCRCALAFRRRPEEGDRDREDDDGPPRIAPTLLVGGAFAGLAAVAYASWAAMRSLMKGIEVAWEGRRWHQWVDSPGAGLMLRLAQEETQRRDLVERQERIRIALLNAMEEALEEDFVFERQRRFPIPPETIRLGSNIDADPGIALDIALSQAGVDEKKSMDKLRVLMESIVLDDEASRKSRSRLFGHLPSVYFGASKMLDDKMYGRMLLRWSTDRDPDVIPEMKKWLDVPNVSDGEIADFLDTFVAPDFARDRLATTDLYARLAVREGLDIDHPDIAELNPNKDPDVLAIWVRDPEMRDQLLSGEGGFTPMPFWRGERSAHANAWVFDNEYGFELTLDRNELGPNWDLPVFYDVYRIDAKLKPDARGIDEGSLELIASELRQSMLDDVHEALKGGDLLPDNLRQLWISKFAAKRPATSEMAMKALVGATNQLLVTGDLTPDQLPRIAEAIAYAWGRAQAADELGSDLNTVARLLGFDYATRFDGRRVVVNPGALILDDRYETWTPADFNPSVPVPEPNVAGLPNVLHNGKLVHTFKASANLTFMVEDSKGQRYFLKAADRGVSDADANEAHFSRLAHLAGLDEIIMPVGRVHVGGRGKQAMIAKLSPAHKVVGDDFQGSADRLNAQSAQHLEDALVVRTLEHYLGVSDRHQEQYGITVDGKLVSFDYEGWRNVAGDPHPNALWTHPFGMGVLPRTRIMEGPFRIRVRRALDRAKEAMEKSGDWAKTPSAEDRYFEQIALLDALDEWDAKTGNLDYEEIDSFNTKLFNGAASGPVGTHERIIYNLYPQPIGPFGTSTTIKPDTLATRVREAIQEFVFQAGAVLPPLPGTDVRVAKVSPIVKALRLMDDEALRADPAHVDIVRGYLGDQLGDPVRAVEPVLNVQIRNFLNGNLVAGQGLETPEGALFPFRLAQIGDAMDDTFGDLVPLEDQVRDALAQVGADWGVGEGVFFRQVADAIDNPEEFEIYRAFKNPEVLDAPMVELEDAGQGLKVVIPLPDRKPKDWVKEMVSKIWISSDHTDPIQALHRRPEIAGGAGNILQRRWEDVVERAKEIALTAEARGADGSYLWLKAQEAQEAIEEALDEAEGYINSSTFISVRSDELRLLRGHIAAELKLGYERNVYTAHQVLNADLDWFDFAGDDVRLRFPGWRFREELRGMAHRPPMGHMAMDITYLPSDLVLDVREKERAVAAIMNAKMQTPEKLRGDLRAYFAARLALAERTDMSQERIRKVLDVIDSMQDEKEELIQALVAIDRADANLKAAGPGLSEIPFEQIDGMAPLRFLVDDIQDDIAAGNVNAWLAVAPDEIVDRARAGNFEAIDFEAFSPEWLARAAFRRVQAASEIEGQNVEGLLLGLKLAIADHKSAETEFLGAMWNLKLREEKLAAVALEVWRPEEVAAYLMGQRGTISRHVERILGQRAYAADGQKVVIPFNLLDVEDRKLVQQQRPVPLVRYVSDTVYPQTRLSPNEWRMIRDGFSAHKKTQKLAPYMHRFLTDPDILENAPTAALMDLIEFGRAVERDLVVDDALVVKARRAAYEAMLANRNKQGDLSEAAAREIALLFAEDEKQWTPRAVLGLVYDAAHVRRDGILAGLRSGFDDNFEVLEALDNFSIGDPISLIDKIVLDLDVDARVVHNRLSTLLPEDVEGNVLNKVGFVAQRDEVLLYLRGRYGVGRMESEDEVWMLQRSMAEEILEWPLGMGLMDRNPSVAVAKLFSHKGATLDEDLGKALLRAAATAQTDDERMAYVARYLTINQVGLVGQSEIRALANEGRLHEYISRVIRFYEAATRERVRTSDIRLMVDEMETRLPEWEVRLQLVVNDLFREARDKDVGDPLVVEDFAPLHPQRLPRAGLIHAIVADSGLPHQHENVAIALIDAYHEALKAGKQDESARFLESFFGEKVSDFVVQAVPDYDMVPTGILDWERQFYTGWRKILARQRVRVPLVALEDAENWYFVVDQDLSVPDVDAFARRIRLMMANPPTSREVQTFRDFLADREEEEWVPMLNQWIQSVNADIMRDALNDQFDAILPAGQAWFFRGLNTDPEVREFVEAWLEAEVGSGSLPEGVLDTLRQRLQEATDGRELISVWVDAHRNARKPWPHLSKDLVDDAANKHRLKDLTRRVILLFEAAVHERLPDNIRDELEKTMTLTPTSGSDEAEKIRMILNQLIDSVNREVLNL